VTVVTVMTLSGCSLLTSWDFLGGNPVGDGLDSALLDGPRSTGDGGSDAALMEDQNGRIVTLASAQDSPTAIAIDQDNVYWTNEVPLGGSVMQCARVEGCSGRPIPVATNQDLPHAIVATARGIFWANLGEGAIRSAWPAGTPDAGASTVVVGPSLPGVTTVAVNGSVVYFTDTGSPGGEIQFIALGSTKPYEVAYPISAPESLIFDPTNQRLFWRSNTGVFSCAPPGPCTYEKISPVATNEPAVHAVAVDESYVYFTNHASPGSVMRTSKDGPDAGLPIPVASDQAGPWAIAVDSEAIYFTNIGSGGRDGSVVKVTKTGTLTVLASGLAAPWGIAVDGASVYWTNHGDGTVQKMPK
jgi:hypothetical protein